MLLLLFISLFFFVESKIKGINLGSYFVLEPYINPSLFYQFIGINTDVNPLFQAKTSSTILVYPYGISA